MNDAIDSILGFLQVHVMDPIFDVDSLWKNLNILFLYVGLDAHAEGLSDKERPSVTWATLRNRLCHFQLWLRASCCRQGLAWKNSAVQKRCTSGLRLLRSVANREAHSPAKVLRQLVEVESVSERYPRLMTSSKQALDQAVEEMKRVLSADVRPFALRRAAFSLQGSLIRCLQACIHSGCVPDVVR